MTAEAEPAKQTIVAAAVASLIGAILASLAFGWFLLGALHNNLALLLVVIAAPSPFLCVLIHELGHLAAAKLVGWRPIVLALRPFGLHFPTGRFVVSGSVNGEDAGGAVMSYPLAPEHNTRLRWIIALLGGPAASLVFGIVFVAIAAQPLRLILESNTWARQTPSHELDGVRAMSGLLGCYGLLSLSAFVRTITPLSYRSGKKSDGRKLLEAWKTPGNPVTPLIWLLSALHYNERLRDVPPWLYDAARRETVPADLTPYLEGLDVGRALDAEVIDAPHARQLIERHRATYGDSDWLLTCDAYLAAVNEGDAVRAGAALAKLQDPDAEMAMIPAAKAGLAARRGDRATTTAELDRMDAMRRKQSPYPDATFRDIRARIEAVLPPA